MSPTGEPVDKLGGLFQQHHASLFNMIARLIGSYDDAHDVLQETFLRAVRSWGQFQGQADPKTWLYRIALNWSYTHLKKTGGHKNVATPDPFAMAPGNEPASDAELLRRERKLLIEKALYSLRTDLRTVILLRDIEELPYSDIAAILGWSEGTVASRLSRARRLLARKLRELGVG